MAATEDFEEPIYIDIEEVFADCIMDLDSIDISSDGFQVRCHDVHGRISEIGIKTAETFFG